MNITERSCFVPSALPLYFHHLEEARPDAGLLANEDADLLSGEPLDLPADLVTEYHLRSGRKSHAVRFAGGIADFNVGRDEARRDFGIVGQNSSELGDAFLFVDWVGFCGPAECHAECTQVGC